MKTTLLIVAVALGMAGFGYFIGFRRGRKSWTNEMVKAALDAAVFGSGSVLVEKGGYKVRAIHPEDMYR